MNAKNCESIAKVKNVDGFLVGGASLNASDFAHIANLGSIEQAEAQPRAD